MVGVLLCFTLKQFYLTSNQSSFVLYGCLTLPLCSFLQKYIYTLHSLEHGLLLLYGLAGN